MSRPVARVFKEGWDALYLYSVINYKTVLINHLKSNVYGNKVSFGFAEEHK